MLLTPGEVHRVHGQPRGAAFRVLSVDGDQVHCWGGAGDRMQFRTFRVDVMGAVVPRSQWPTLLLPRDERAEAERARSERRTQRKLART